MITKANKDIANRKYTYFFMATSTAPRKRKRLTACDSQVQSEVCTPDHNYVSHVICARLPFQLFRIMLCYASFECYMRQNFGFFPPLKRIVCCLANARQQITYCAKGVTECTWEVLSGVLKYTPLIKYSFRNKHRQNE